MQSFTIHREGTRVQLIVNGQLVADMPWDAAIEIADGIKQQALRAEEIVKREQIIMDQAILIRSGAPLGLTRHPYLLHEAGKTAAWDKDLRRYMPGGVKSEEKFGTPTIIQHPPRGKK